MSAPKLRLVQQRSERAADKSPKKSASRKKSEAAAPIEASAAPDSPPSNLDTPKARKRAKSSRVAKDLMTSPVLVCRPGDNLNHAAQLLWENNLGALVVVDDEQRPVSMITDRDICFAAYTQGVALWSSSVASAMASGVVVCPSDAPVSEVRRLMSAAKVRRLPVVDDAGQLVGILGMADLCRPKGTQSTAVTTAGEMMQLVSAWVEPG